MRIPNVPVRLEVPCPGCKAKNPVQFRRNDPDPHFTCTGCGQLVQLDGARLLEDVERALEKGRSRLAKALGKLNKR